MRAPTDTFDTGVVCSTSVGARNAGSYKINSTPVGARIAGDQQSQ